MVHPCPCEVPGERPAQSGFMRSSASGCRTGTINCPLPPGGPCIHSGCSPPSPQPHLRPHTYPGILVAFSQQTCPFLNFHWAYFYSASSASSLLGLRLGQAGAAQDQSYGGYHGRGRSAFISGGVGDGAVQRGEKSTDVSLQVGIGPGLL